MDTIRKGGGDISEASRYVVIDPLERLKSMDRIAHAFQAIDWSFSDADTGFLTHALHPYPAKFIPQIPSHCIELLTVPGDIVLDPFGGSGTTALEAIRLNRRAVSLDANPVGTLIGQVKTGNWDKAAIVDLQAIRSALVSHNTDLADADALCAEHKRYIPAIPNMDKWFPVTSRGELALIRSRIAEMKNAKARNIALLAFSRIVLSSSFQDSETRYTSKPRAISPGQTLQRFISALDKTMCDIRKTRASLRYGACEFLTTDSRNLSHEREPESIDLIVTSPPYGNAHDYHLYHRFRLLWLGHDPRNLGRIEIGSHLRHQREASGFDSYISDMERSLAGMAWVLRSGRYAVLVVGDAIYKKTLYPVAEVLSQRAEGFGLETVCIVERSIHRTKRSFTPAGRRVNTEKILVLRKQFAPQTSVWFHPPLYQLRPYEKILREREIKSVVGATILDDECRRRNGQLRLALDPYAVTKARKLVFTHGVQLTSRNPEPTWQAIIENGFARQVSARKDPKYVTHGLHPYKGKFYPQLAKGLLNLYGSGSGLRVFDPFCGSGTTLLEAYLNGHASFGCDMNPLAAKIAKSKVKILEIDPDIVHASVDAVVSAIAHSPTNPPEETEQFHTDCLYEIGQWFPNPVVAKLNWLLRSIRSVSGGVVKDFLEIVLSSIIREVSQQHPNDLRIRRRREPIVDADVFQLYLDALDAQYKRIEKFWSVRGYAPEKFRDCRVVEGDSRESVTMKRLGLEKDSVDLILTSPPYATALPYIDTDRLSMLVLFGMPSLARRPLERNLVGSREIMARERGRLERLLAAQESELPETVCKYLHCLHSRVTKTDLGFRRKNMPALLLRFFQDMKQVLKRCHFVLRNGGEAMFVVGDNRMRVDHEYERIPTTDFLQEIAMHCGFRFMEHIDISVTTENTVHIKNAITKNRILRFSTI